MGSLFHLRSLTSELKGSKAITAINQSGLSDKLVTKELNEEENQFDCEDVVLFNC